ncbi:hypothetical protein [Plantactinospora sp. B5E13]|uniref:hypothetical protein n=1 Tax=Plantactinospora sp. B5E13 TaxID=3153758 RepID=UPI00325DC2D6
MSFSAIPRRRAERPVPADSAHLSGDEVNRNGLPPYTTNARSLVDAAAWAGSDNTARAIIAAGFQQRLVGADDVHRVAQHRPTLRRRALILASADDARGGSESLAELRYFRAARRAGLPEPSRQHRRRDSSGRVRYLDVYYEQWGVHVEIDGGQHLDVRQQWADMRRQNEVWIGGDRILRFPAWLVRERPDEVVAQVRRRLARLTGAPDRREAGAEIVAGVTTAAPASLLGGSVPAAARCTGARPAVPHHRRGPGPKRPARMFADSV